MHQSSYALMQRFADTVRRRFAGNPVRILDVGSNSVNGSYKDLFAFAGAEYIGLDIQPGPNVDIVPEDPYEWKSLPDNSFDVIISGQALEHTEFPWLTFDQIGRKLKPNGIACLVAPSRGPEHRYPVDCYRFYPDGLRALARWSGLKVLECDYLRSTSGFGPESDAWGDCHCVLTKEGSHSVQPRPADGHSSGRSGGKHRDNPLNLTDGRYFTYERLEVVQLIAQQGIRAKRILELGCASGTTARRLRELLSPEQYVGIEIDRSAAEQARTHVSQVHVADINTAGPTNLGLALQSFDLLLALDVLEHLHNPWDVLAAYSETLAPGGYAVLSIPNIANVEIIRQLTQGRWRYEASGLLDATHLRFFTRETIARLVGGAGLALTHVAAVLNPRPDLAQLQNAANNVESGNLRISNLSRQEVLDLFTFQFLVVARKPSAT